MNKTLLAPSFRIIGAPKGKTDEQGDREKRKDEGQENGKKGMKVEGKGKRDAKGGAKGFVEGEFYGKQGRGGRKESAPQKQENASKIAIKYGTFGHAQKKEISPLPLVFGKIEGRKDEQKQKTRGKARNGSKGKDAREITHRICKAFANRCARIEKGIGRQAA